MKHSWEILLIATKLERAALRSILAEFTAKWQREVAPTMPVRSESEDALYNEELQDVNWRPVTSKDEMSSRVISVTNTAVKVRDVHEANRAQRDVEIIMAGRRKLMKGCMDAVVGREAKMDRIVAIREKAEEQKK